MIKLTFLREEDYWIFPLSIFAILGIVAMIYTSVLTYRLPSAIIGIGLLWFTTREVNKGYKSNLAWAHVAICLGISLLLFWLLFDLTN